MPNRIIREGWIDSEKINQLSTDAERFLTRLMLKADDFGRYHAHPGLLKASLFPLKLDTIREADISRWTAECAKAGLIALYESSAKRYLVILNFNQRTRAQGSKFPSPPADCQSNDGQMTDTRQTSAHGDGDGDGDECDARARDAGAVIPTVEEVVTFGKGPAGIPEDYCRNYHAKRSEESGWIKNGRLIDWRAQMARYWSADRATWKGSNANSNRSGQQSNRNAGTANATSKTVYKANV